MNEREREREGKRERENANVVEANDFNGCLLGLL